MKRLRFKTPFNGMDNALKLIPESYKVNGKEFELTDGIESYRVRWEKTPTILTASNKNLMNEDMQKMKHLMQYNSKDTLGNLRGKERINENKVFNDVLNKTKKLIKEGDDNEIDKSKMFSRDPNERNLFFRKHYREKRKKGSEGEKVPSEHKFTDGELKKIKDRLDLMEDKKEDKPKKKGVIRSITDYFKQIKGDLTPEQKEHIDKTIEIMKKINNSDDKLEEVIDKDKGHEAPKDKGDDAGPTSKKPKTRTPIKR